MNEKSRVIRVFLSSTFRDFGEERDLLVKKVFPELRRLCRQRQVELVDVDLRWGITAEEAEQGKVLPICLAEIDRARPYFMGFIGERYGWVPEESEYPEVVVEREPWLEEHQGGKSVTELEMLHGVLNNPEMAGRAFFYFRDKDYSLSKGGDYEPESPEHAVKLEKLRARLRESQFPVVENYPDPEALAERVREDLLKVIEEEYPEEDVPDAMALERMRHDAYGAARRRFYLGGDDEYFRALDDAVAKEGEEAIPVLVNAEAGLGKSAFISNWCDIWATNHPRDLIFLHHFDASSDATDPVNMVRRLIAEVSAHTEEEIHPEKDPDAILKQLPSVLEAMSNYATREKCQWLLILDGLDKITSQEHLRWFPRSIPRGLEFVVSCSLGSVDLALRPLLNWEFITLKPFGEAQGRKFIGEYLGKFHKSLTESMVKSILKHPLSGRPIWLLTLLEELRLFGLHEEVEQRLEMLLSDPPSKKAGEEKTIDDLFEHVLARIEEDIEGDYEIDAFKAIWASLDGLSREELMEVTKMPPAKWSEIQNGLDENLYEAAGQITFGNQFIRKAVEDMHLPTAASRREAHRWLGEWFDKRELTLDVARERVHQWLSARDYERARSCLLDERVFVELYSAEDSWQGAVGSLYKFWRIDLKMSPLEVEKAYEEVVDLWSGDQESLRLLRVFLHSDMNSFGPFTTRLEIENYRRVAESKGPVHKETIRALYRLGCYYLFNQGDLVAAERILRDSLEKMIEVYGPEDPLTLFNTAQLGNALQYQKKLDEAEALYRKNLTAREKVLGVNYIHTLWSVNDLGSVLRDKGEYEEAEPFLRRVLSEKRKILTEQDTDLVRSVHRLGLLLLKKGDLDGAVTLLDEAHTKRSNLLGDINSQTLSSIKALGHALCLRGDFERGLIYLKQALEGYKTTLPESHSVRTSLILLLAGVVADLDGHRKGLAMLSEYVSNLESPDIFSDLSLARSACLEGNLSGARLMVDYYLKLYPEEKKSALADDELLAVRSYIEDL